MEEEEENPNTMTYLVRDLQEEIFLRLPLKSIIKFKTISKQWRSTLESRRFAERRRMIMKILQKNPQIMAAVDKQTSIPVRRPVKDEKEVELFYLHYHEAATRPSLTCNGLVCMPVPGYVNVLNPSTGEFLRFPSGPTNSYNDQIVLNNTWGDIFPGYWAMGFGKDIVNGSYKVVRMLFDTMQYEILDINIGEWREIPSLPPYNMEARKKSACVNGFIYWLQHFPRCKILALDLHTEQFRDVRLPPSYAPIGQIVNLEDRLAISTVSTTTHHWELCIWSMEEETWSKRYTIPLLFYRDLYTDMLQLRLWCKPVTVSKQGNVFFHDNENRLFEYCPKTNQVGIIERNICVISPFVENLFPLGSSGIRTYGFQYLDDDVSSFGISEFLKGIDLRNPKVLLTTSAVALVAYGFSPVSVPDLIGTARTSFSCVSDLIRTTHSRVVDIGNKISFMVECCALICILAWKI